ncbi:MAG: helix-turn-helix domain-containing protein [Acidobacteria bacterium]|nr:helix-turn-helix domain-containing protein [Acidobacteriota bacterium]
MANLSTPQNPLGEKTVTVKEAAFRLGKSPDAVYQWLRSGRLRGRQPGGRGCAILVVESSVNDALLFSFERAGAGRSRPGPLTL